MSDKEKPTNGKKGVNWTGIATLVTALGGVLGMFVVQDKGRNESEMVSESVFVIMNARLDRMENRLERIESMFMHGTTAMMVASPECDTDMACPEGHICDEGQCVEEAVEAAPPVERPAMAEPAPPIRYDDFKDIKEYVQTKQEPVRFKK